MGRLIDTRSSNCGTRLVSVLPCAAGHADTHFFATPSIRATNRCTASTAASTVLASSRWSSPSSEPA